MKFNVGDIISANDPLVHVIDPTKKNRICDYCMSYGKQLKKCSGCKNMFYCDQKCQKTDWSKHKYECKIYAANYDFFNCETERLFLRMVLFLTKNPQSMKKKYSLFYDKNIGRTYEDMMTHSENISKDERLCLAFKLLCAKFQEFNISFDESKFFEMFCKHEINSFAILNADSMSIGSGVYVAESMFNHSCTPNAAPVSNGVHMEIRCIRPIEEGEPITICYVSQEDPKLKRQKILKKYYFDCNCPRCEQDLPRDFDYEHLRSSLELMSDYMKAGEFEEAFKICQKIEKDYEKVYEGRPHPNVTVFMVRMSNLRIEFTNQRPNFPRLDAIGIALATKAAKLIKLTYPEDHNMYQFYEPFM